MQTTKLNFQEDVIEALAFDPRVIADDIAVAVKEGIVSLRGMVPSFNQKWLAQDVVKCVRGVRGIVDELTVELPTNHVQHDADIALSIEHRFESNAVIPEDVTFVVKDGYVTLKGEVAWYYQAQEAAYEARRVMGVRDVTNLITFKSVVYPSADEIKEKIHTALERTVDVNAEEIDVAVSGGAVTLSGNGRSWLERENAAQVAWSIPGVSHVDNFIGVDPW